MARVQPPLPKLRYCHSPGAGFCGACGAALGFGGGGGRDGVAVELEHLGRLHAAGELDDAEYQMAKAAVLAGARPPRVASSAAAPAPPLTAPALAAMAGFAAASVGVASRLADDVVQLSGSIWTREHLSALVLVLVFSAAAWSVQRQPGGSGAVATAAAVPALCFAAFAPLVIRHHTQTLGWWLGLAGVAGAAVAAVVVVTGVWPRTGWAPPRLVLLCTAAATAGVGAALTAVDRYADVTSGEHFGRLYAGAAARPTVVMIQAVLVAVPLFACAVARSTGAALAVGLCLTPLLIGDGGRLVSVVQGDTRALPEAALVPLYVALAVGLAMLIAWMETTEASEEALEEALGPEA